MSQHPILVSVSTMASSSRSRRGNGTSYREKLQNLSNVKGLTEAALDKVTEEKNSLINIGNRVQAIITEMISTMNASLVSVSGSHWVLDANGNLVVPAGLTINHNDQLVPDTSNAFEGIKKLIDVVDAQGTMIDTLLEHIEDTNQSLVRRALIGNDNLLGTDRPLGLSISADYETRGPPRSLARELMASSARVENTSTNDSPPVGSGVETVAVVTASPSAPRRAAGGYTPLFSATRPL